MSLQLVQHISRLASSHLSASQTRVDYVSSSTLTVDHSSKAMLAVRLSCAFLSILLYLNSLTGQLVFDDRAAIIENGDLRPSAPWTNLLWHDFWGDDLAHHKSHKSYRPLASASFKINYHLHQLDETGYHLVNVVLNGLVCYLFVQTCEVVFSGNLGSVSLAGLLFAAHPIHTEAVSSLRKLDVSFDSARCTHACNCAACGCLI